MNSIRKRRLGLALTLASCAVMSQVADAGASTVTVGTVFPPGFAPAPVGQVQTLFNTSLPEKGANLSSPVDGVIVRWRVLGAVGGPFSLRVLNPNGSGAYEAAGTSAAVSPTSKELQTFTTSLSIHKGDLIGIDPSNGTDEIGMAAVPGANYAFIFPPPFNGSTVAPSGSESGKEIALSAEVQPAPVVLQLEEFEGSIAGGTLVKIKGENLTGATGVKFGDVPAAGFNVESDTLITATSPRVLNPGFADVTVTTAAGTSPIVRSDRFKYVACVVPKLKGKKLTAARNLAKKAGCALGKVRGNKKGKVKSQTPAPGTVKAPGAKVNVKLAGRKRH
jgi:hypothetical protein